MSNRTEVHTLGVFVHGALSALHALGCVYNMKRRNHFDTGAHFLGLVYSARATVHHARQAEIQTRNGMHGIESV
jgi:hypothetical protein